MMRALVAMVVVAACSKEAPVDRTAAAKAHEKAHAAVAAPVAPRPRPAQLAKVTIKALGMYCEESCPLKVRTALADVPAVYELGFDVSNESIFVSYDASLGTPKDVTKPMLVAIKSAGFDPWLAKETWPEDASVQVVPN
jgi:hypothetical protein